MVRTAIISLSLITHSYHRMVGLGTTIIDVCESFGQRLITAIVYVYIGLHVRQCRLTLFTPAFHTVLLSSIGNYTSSCLRLKNLASTKIVKIEFNAYLDLLGFPHFITFKECRKVPWTAWTESKWHRRT